MQKSPWKLLLFSLIAGLLVPALWAPIGRALARSSAAQPAAIVEPFLYPPYPGTASEESVFDHSNPYYIQTDELVVAYSGDVATKRCPVPQPPGTRPPQAWVCDAGGGIYWSYSLGDWIAYNGHDGTDYGINYRPLYAAADTDQVVYAGWHDPQNHRYGLGLYVKLRHPNGYQTSYGHMSAVSVYSCPAPGCVNYAHGEVIGISGTTGNSSGPHLHLRVVSPEGKAVDPYGWIGETTDPWPYNQSHSLWAAYPSTVPYWGSSVLILPSGDPLPYPAAVSGGTIIDDNDVRFVESPAGCWTVTNTEDGQSENNNMRYRKPIISGPTSCTAKWKFPSTLPAGVYAVYVRIPAVHATSQGAVYAITHAGLTNRLYVNQEVFPNRFFVTDGWVYLGKYDFAADGGEYVVLGNKTEDDATDYSSRELGVDAVRFVYQSEIPPTSTPTPTNTPGPSPTPTASRTLRPTDTRWPTLTRTPTSGPRPTDTRWPTNTVRPTDTRWPSKTPTITRTTLPTDTRWPTRTLTPSKTPTASRTSAVPITPTPSRTASVAPPTVITSTPSPTASQTPLPPPPPGTTATHTRWPSPTVRPTDTRWPTRTLRPTSTRWPTATRYQPYTLTPSRTPTPSRTFTPAYVITITPTSTPWPTWGVRPTDTLWPTRTVRPTDTRWPSQTPRPTSTRWPTRTSVYTSTPIRMVLSVYFTDSNRLVSGTPPFEVIVIRYAPAGSVAAQAVLEAFFEGPTTAEQTQGIEAVLSGFTGFSLLRIENKVAHVYLTGTCRSLGATYTIAQPLRANLLQFPEILWVKIYDENGSTQYPSGQSDSIPACLEP